MSKRNIIPCTLAVAVIAAIGATGATAAKKPKFAMDTASLSASLGDQQSFHRFVVQYRDGTREKADRSAGVAAFSRALNRSGLARGRIANASHVRTLANGQQLIKLSRSLDRVEADALLRQIKADPNVVSVRPDRLRQIARLPPQPLRSPTPRRSGRRRTPRRGSTFRSRSRRCRPTCSTSQGMRPSTLRTTSAIEAP